MERVARGKTLGNDASVLAPLPETEPPAPFPPPAGQKPRAARWSLTAVKSRVKMSELSDLRAHDMAHFADVEEDIAKEAEVAEELKEGHDAFLVFVMLGSCFC